MSALELTPRERGRFRTHSTPNNSRHHRTSPTRSQRKADRLPKKHHNIFDQTLLPEEDFSGGKLLRHRKTSGETDHAPKRKRKSLPAPQSAPLVPQDQIEVSTPPQRPVSQPVPPVQRASSVQRPSSSYIPQREFRVRDRNVDYTIPSLKSILVPTTPPQPQKRRSSAPPPKIQTREATPVSKTPIVNRPPVNRTVIQRNGQKSLLVKVKLQLDRFPELQRKSTPRIKIVESASGRKRRIQEEEEEEVVEPKKESEKPFGGILSKEDADTSKTTPVDIDRVRFERARESAANRALSSITVVRSASEVPSSAGGHPIAETAFKVRHINFGNYRVKTHYASPYPEEYSRQSVLGICEFCLKYMSGDYVAWRHRLKCPVKHPPGDEIYRDGKISIFEVDGRKNPVYCQNLCLLAKMYLDHKTLYYDVEPFLFYVLCECDDQGCHFVGYFSKEKRSMAGYNLSCIVTLPIYQRKGYGFFLISFSYLLSQREGRLGSPEKPLSDLGLLSYRSYWKTALARALLEILDEGVTVSIQELGKRTGMTDDDVVSGLEGLDALVKDMETGVYAIKVNPEKLLERVQLVDKKGYVKVKKELLKWTPYIVGRREAREMLNGGLEDLIRNGDQTANGVVKINGESMQEEVDGEGIPPERFVSVAVRDLVPPPRVTYDTTEPQTPIPITEVMSDAQSSTSSSDEEDDPVEDPDVSSPSPSAADEVDDESSSAEEFEDASEEEMSDYVSDDSTDYPSRKRRRLDDSRGTTPKLTPEVVVRVKNVAKAPKNRAATFGSQDGVVKQAPRIAAKAPRSRAGQNPPEVMSRRTSLRRI